MEHKIRASYHLVAISTISELGFTCPILCIVKVFLVSTGSDNQVIDALDLLAISGLDGATLVTER